MKCNLNTAGKRGVLSDGFFSGKINYMCEKLWQSEGKWAEGKHNRAQGTGTNQPKAAVVCSTSRQQWRAAARSRNLRLGIGLPAAGCGERTESMSWKRQRCV